MTSNSESLRDEMTAYRRQLEGKAIEAYAEALRVCVSRLEELDRETSYYPNVEIYETGTPGRWGEEGFFRGWNMSPRQWPDSATEEETKVLRGEIQDLKRKLVAKETELVNALQAGYARR